MKKTCAKMVSKNPIEEQRKAKKSRSLLRKGSILKGRHFEREITLMRHQKYDGSSEDYKISSKIVLKVD